MSKSPEVDLWVRGSSEAVTATLTRVTPDASVWTDADVRMLLTEMLRALERQRNPSGEVPPVTLKGFSWIVSPDPGGVLVHLEMQLGTASAGPFAIAESHLTGMITRVLERPEPVSETVH